MDLINGERKVYKQETTDPQFCLDTSFICPYLDLLHDQQSLTPCYGDQNEHFNLLDMPDCAFSDASAVNSAYFQPPPGFGLLQADLHNAAVTESAAYPFLNPFFQGDSEMIGFEQTLKQQHSVAAEQSDRQGRENFKDKFQHLRSLLPNPTKNDRASIVEDAIDYIQELKRNLKKLNTLVKKKKKKKKKMMMIKSEPLEPLGCSYAQRKCKDTEIDVCIIYDEVTIKLLQRKKMNNCLFYVSRASDELGLDVQHVTSGHVGDSCSFFLNTKMLEGCSVYAAAVANKIIQVLEREYAATS